MSPYRQTPPVGGAVYGKAEAALSVQSTTTIGARHLCQQPPDRIGAAAGLKGDDLGRDQPMLLKGIALQSGLQGLQRIAACQDHSAAARNTSSRGQENPLIIALIQPLDMRRHLRIDFGQGFNIGQHHNVNDAHSFIHR